MTVAELKKKLDEYDDGTRVIVDGYEGGFCDITELEEVDVVLNVNDEWYYGPHSRPDALAVPEGKGADETALLL
jgi:hypothetical protein